MTTTVYTHYSSTTAAVILLPVSSETAGKMVAIGRTLPDPDGGLVINSPPVNQG